MWKRKQTFRRNKSTPSLKWEKVGLSYIPYSTRYNNGQNVLLLEENSVLRQIEHPERGVFVVYSIGKFSVKLYELNTKQYFVSTPTLICNIFEKIWCNNRFCFNCFEWHPHHNFYKLCNSCKLKIQTEEEYQTYLERTNPHHHEYKKGPWGDIYISFEDIE